MIPILNSTVLRSRNILVSNAFAAVSTAEGYNLHIYVVQCSVANIICVADEINLREELAISYTRTE